jgi:pentose-5-phosphate-3-epimerase
MKADINSKNQIILVAESKKDFKKIIRLLQKKGATNGCCIPPNRHDYAYALINSVEIVPSIDVSMIDISNMEEKRYIVGKVETELDI